MRYASGVAAEAKFVNQPHANVATDDHVVVLINTSASRNGETLDGGTLNVFDVSDAKIAECWVIPGDQFAQGEFWAD